MEKNRKQPTQYILVDRKVVANAMRDKCKASYMILFLTYLLYARNIKLTMTTEDVCEVVGIDYQTFEKYCRQERPRHSVYGDIKLYELNDLVDLLEAATRKERYRQLCKIPTAFTRYPKG